MYSLSPVICTLLVIAACISQLPAASAQGAQLDPYWPSPPPPDAPFPISFLDDNTALSICGGFGHLSCVTALDWHIDLPPLIYYPPPNYFEAPRCIGWEGRCIWKTIKEFLDGGNSDTYTYLVRRLNITIETASQAFLMGARRNMPSVLNSLLSLNVTCTQPIPVFGLHIINTLVNMVTIPQGNDSIVPQPPALQLLTMPSCNLTGLLPPSPAALPSLSHLDLSSNLLSGTLPSQFGASSLLKVNLSHNMLSGVVPPFWTRFGGCGAWLDLSYNRFTGLAAEWEESSCSEAGKTPWGLSTRDLSRLGGQLDTCNVDGVLWRNNNTNSGSEGRFAQMLPASESSSGVLQPFPFSVLLYGNPDLDVPEGEFYVAFAPNVSFNIHDNGCTSYDIHVLLIIMWASVLGGGLLLGALLALVLALYGAIQRMRVAPSSGALIAPAKGVSESSTEAAQTPEAVQLTHQRAWEVGSRVPGQQQQQQEPGAVRTRVRASTELPRMYSLEGEEAEGGVSVQQQAPVRVQQQQQQQAQSQPGAVAEAREDDGPVTAVTAAGAVQPEIDQDAAAAAVAAAPPSSAGGSPRLQRIRERVGRAARAARSILAATPGFIWSLRRGLRVLGLSTWYLAFSAAAVAAIVALGSETRRAYCTDKVDCLPWVYIAPVVLLLVPHGLAGVLLLAL